MTEIKLNTWRWGVVPELDDDAVVMTGGDIRNRPTRPWVTCSYAILSPKFAKRWYVILSRYPPEMPEEELRLPEGWEVDDEDTSVEDEHSITIMHFRSRIIVASLTVFEPTRAECVREINRILGGER